MITGHPLAIGERYVNYNPLVGGRFTGRYFIDEGWGIVTSGFWFENGSKEFGVVGHPVIALPIVDPTTGAETAIRIARLALPCRAPHRTSALGWSARTAAPAASAEPARAAEVRILERAVTGVPFRAPADGGGRAP